MPIPEQIQTVRLKLRPVRVSDAPEVFERYASDPEVTRYLVWRPHKSVDETVAYLSQKLDGESIFQWLVFPRDGGPLLGAIGCHVDKHVVQFGYCYARDAWGRGYATEVATVMVQEWLSEPTIWRIQAFCDPENIASARVLEKAGLTFEGTLRKYMLTPSLGDEPRDVRCYARVRN